MQGEREKKKKAMEVFPRVLLLLLLLLLGSVSAARHDRRLSVGGQVVKKESRRTVAESEAGTITAVDVADGAGTAYRLQFITMDPSSLFLPVLLHADMVFYVHTGRGKVSYVDEENSEANSIDVERGDVYSLEQGTAFYIQSLPSATRERLRIYAIFTSETINVENPSKPTLFEAYSSISDLVRGFEDEVLRMGFGVSKEAVEEIKSAKSLPSIIPYTPQDEKKEKSDWREGVFEALLGVRDPHLMNKKKKKKEDKSKSKTFNFYSGKPDVENCYGWSRVMTSKDLKSLRGTNIGMFMVNLTAGSMMGPHWNPKATEIAIVTHGQGMVQIVCPTNNPSGQSKRGYEDKRGDLEDTECKNSVFRVNEGDVFVVPMFHPMAQISFNNDSFVFVGFSTDVGRNHPQFLAGKLSVLQVIDKEILALSFGSTNSTIVQELLSAQRDAIILGCISCAEELERKTEEQEGGKGRREEEERRRREEEEEGRREEERAKKEEEERRRREEEEERRREEEEEEEEEEEKAERRREKEKAKREEEERRRREEEEERRREEEEGRPKRREEEEEEGEHGRREEEEGEKRRRREEEERERTREREEEGEEPWRREEWPGRREEEQEGEEEYYRAKKMKKHVHGGKVASKKA